jgi:ATP-dependent DNA helicase RecQ
MTSEAGQGEEALRDEAEHTLREEAERCLRALAGPSARLREDQWTAIQALARDRRRALVVQRTGWGKSAVYFVTTALLRARDMGPTIIISPLLALMRNQIEAAARAGLRARTVNSANMADWDEIYAEIAAGSVDLLLVSPERLNNPGFRDLVLPKLAATAGMLVVDEAHCISDWGHDFRPDYRRLRTVLENLPPGVPVLATTATANARVTRDVAEQLASGADGEALVLRGPLDRESLCLGVVQLPAAQQRLGWLAEHLDELPGSGIIYTLTVAAAHETAAFLRDRGHNVLPYTGRDEQEQRLTAERALLDGELKALVATSALGMGFDKPDLGFVVHLGAPQSPVAYYQQIGRAGRAVPRAEVVLLPGPEDRDIWAYFASLAFPPEALVRTTLGALDAASGPLSSGALETQVDLSRARLEMMLKVLDVDGAVRKVSGGWAATGQPWEYDAERYATVAAERHREQQAMLSYLRTPGCRMEYLRRQLDDPEAQPCGRCDNCTGRPWPAEVSAEGAELARARLLRPGIDISPRRMWPPGMKRLGVDVAGKIPAELSADTGRALGRLTGLGWGPRLRALLEPGADAAAPHDPLPDDPVPGYPVPGGPGSDGPVPDGPVPPDLVAALVQVLAAWDWEQRPAGVVTLPSHTRPQLIASLGERIAEIGRLPLLGSLSYAGSGPRVGASAAQQFNSPQRLQAVWRELRLPGPLAGAVASLGGPVLVIDDRIDSGWTMTVAARLLREAGAPRVLPLVLAVKAG